MLPIRQRLPRMREKVRVADSQRRAQQGARINRIDVRDSQHLGNACSRHIASIYHCTNNTMTPTTVSATPVISIPLMRSSRNTSALNINVNNG